MTSEGAHDHDPADPTRTTSSAGGTEPVGEIIDAEVLDTEVVDTASPGSSFPGSTTISSPGHIDPDYSEQGVPSFDFVRDKIEKRISTAVSYTHLTLPTNREV